MVKKKLGLIPPLNLNKWRLVVFALGAGLVGLLIFISRAAPVPPTIYLNPSTQVLAVNTTFTVQVRENSGTTAVNAVQANISYPATLLDYVSMDTTGSAFGTEAQATGGAGVINIGRGTCGGCATLTGDQLVTTITFKTKTTGGIANVTFTSGTALVSSSTNQDILGSLAATGPGAYTIDTNPPTVSVTSPTNGSTIAYGNSVSITATSSDSEGAVSTVSFWVDGVQKGTDSTSPYSYNWNTTGYSLGTHTIQAQATDSQGNTGSSTMITVTLSDQGAPTVSLTAPSASAYLKGSVSVSATASDNIGVVGVQFKLDGVNLGAEDTISPYSITWDTTTASNGMHSLTAVARDAAGNTTTSSALSVTVDNGAPSVTITTPTTGSTVSGSSTAISATAADNIGIIGVQFKLDGVNLGTEDTISPYSYTWNTTTTTSGAHNLTAVARDAAGNTTTSTVVSVTVNNTPPPTVTLTPSKTYIYNGNSLTLSWSSTNATSCSASGAWTGTLAVSGSQSVSPTTTSTYTLSCSGAGGSNSTSTSVTVYKSGDANHDGTVNIFDLSTMLSNYNIATTSCDFNTDGIVNIVDLSILLSNYGL